MKYQVPVRSALVVALVLSTTLVAVGFLASSHGGLSLSLDVQGAGCRGFWGETVQTVSWSGDGRYVAVASTLDRGIGRTRVFEWPGMALRTRAVTEVGGNYVAVADDGSIYWTTWDPYSTAEAATTLWRQSIGGAPEPLGTLMDGRYESLTWAAGSLMAVEWRNSPEARRVVRLSSSEPASEPLPLTDWLDRAGDVWVDRSGTWFVWVESNVPSDDPNEIVVQHEGRETRSTLPGYGGRVPSLTPARDAAIYQRSETARLTVVDLATGTLRGELDPRHFYGGEISSQGILAAPTAHGPWSTNELCVLDVAPRLAELARGVEAAEPAPPLPAERLASRDALIAAARAGGPVRIDALVPGNWTSGSTFRAYADNVTALNVLGEPFDLEGAIRSLGDEDGTVFVLSGDAGVVAWFAVPASDLCVSFAGGGFARDAAFRVIPGNPPALGGRGSGCPASSSR